MHANSIFEIISIKKSNDGLYSRAQIRYINPEGPIETGEKTIDAFETEQNPNNDIIRWIQIPSNLVTGELISTEEFKQLVANQCPFDEFEKMNNAILITIQQEEEYNNLIGKRESIEPEDLNNKIILEEL